MPSSARTYSAPLSLLLVAPLLVLLTFGFVYPVGSLIWGSFLGGAGPFANYERIVSEPLFLKILLRTFQVALAVSILTFLLGYPVAYAMARLKGRLASIVLACVLLSLWTSVLVRSYAWIVLLQRNGILNTFMLEVGIVESPLRLLYTEGAVIMAMSHILLPFMILPIYSALRGIPEEYMRAARNLGAGTTTVFIRIILPLSLPGVFAGSLMTFILALGFYVTPALVGGPRTLMMATLIGQQATEMLNWPFAGALAAVLLGSTLLVAFVFRKVLTLNKGFDHGN
ncbi:ABC transporter permease [Aureimonas fodinaquatilis]|uniref:ABC transporter permease n=1 Tax=Aureimonas fodinaquatilis TaxID=2565783 RepID=A0A5B0DRQ3_9HYPH|nr:ABC transporter permease [Aureimonas fodinaquatilis]KAA0969474.1 ABC transporter permease [Aureimonas fodinaquatilis]